MSQEEDVPEVSSHALHGLLADLNIPSSSTLNAPPSSSLNTLSDTQSSSWTFSGVSSRPLPFSHGSGPAPLLQGRMPSREHSLSAPELDVMSPGPSGQQQTLFNTPIRSIISSGPPTSSLSANTAQASMSPPSIGAPHPLTSLSMPVQYSSRRVNHQPEYSASSSRRVRISRAEKDVDDPSSPIEDPRSSEGRNGTPTSLSRLFAPPEPDPSISRRASYNRTNSGQYTRGE